MSNNRRLKSFADFYTKLLYKVDGAFSLKTDGIEIYEKWNMEQLSILAPSL